MGLGVVAGATGPPPESREGLVETGASVFAPGFCSGVGSGMKIGMKS